MRQDCHTIAFVSAEGTRLKMLGENEGRNKNGPPSLFCVFCPVRLTVRDAHFFLTGVSLKIATAAPAESIEFRIPSG
jgi:hypothetical protein